MNLYRDFFNCHSRVGGNPFPRNIEKLCYLHGLDPPERIRGDDIIRPMLNTHKLI